MFIVSADVVMRNFLFLIGLRAPYVIGLFLPAFIHLFTETFVTALLQSQPIKGDVLNNAATCEF